MKQQRDWAGANDPAQVADNLRRLGRRAGMNDAELSACLEDADTALELTEFYQANAEARQYSRNAHIHDQRAAI